VYKDWRGAFYPEKLPSRGWAEQTPANFEFAVKGGQVLTAEEQGQKLLVFTATPGTDELAT